MPLPTPSHNAIVAIAERIRAVVERHPGHTLDDVAESLLLEPKPFLRLIEEPNVPIDTEFVVDVVAALVYCQGMDPQWLLSGRYDPAMHRHALLLGEERGVNGMARMREFVQEQFEGLRRNTPPYLAFPGLNPPQSD